MEYPFIILLENWAEVQATLKVKFDFYSGWPISAIYATLSMSGQCNSLAMIVDYLHFYLFRLVAYQYMYMHATSLLPVLSFVVPRK